MIAVVFWGLCAALTLPGPSRTIVVEPLERPAPPSDPAPQEAPAPAVEPEPAPERAGARATGKGTQAVSDERHEPGQEREREPTPGRGRRR